MSERVKRRAVLMAAGNYKVGIAMKAPAPSDGLPAQVATLAAYEVDATEVTVAEYAACVTAGSCSPPPVTSDGSSCNWPGLDRQDHPINCVSYEQAEAFCRWDGKRLPSEIEWEAAARASGAPRISLQVYSPGPIAHACARSEEGDSPVDGLPGLARGTCPVGHDAEHFSRRDLHDFTGNVREYTTGHLCEYRDPRCKARIVRGTAWVGHLYEEVTSRRLAPERAADVGVRCVRSVSDGAPP